MKSETIEKNDQDFYLSPKALLGKEWRPIKSLGVKQLRSELEAWRSLSTWIDDVTRYYLSNMGQMVRIVRRDYKGYLGDFLGAKFILDEVEVGVYDKVYDQNLGRYFQEKKIIKVGEGSVVSMEFIQERHEAIEADEEALGDVLITKE